MANTSFSARTQGRTAMPPVAACLHVVFPPFHRALHSRHTNTLASVSFHSTRLDLAYFRGRARTSFFGPCAMANPSFSAQTQGRTAMPPVVARLRVVFPPFHRALHSRHTYTLASVSFHSTRLDLAYFRGRAPVAVCGPARHGEPLVFSPDAWPNSPAARRQRSIMPFTQGIRRSFGFFPHAGT